MKRPDLDNPQVGRSLSDSRRVVASVAVIAIVGCLVVGSNVHGAATTPTAVTAPSGCVIDPSDVIGWWKGEDNSASMIGPDLSGPVGYGSAAIGHGFAFDGTNILGSSTLAPVSTGLTVEMWVKPDPTVTGRMQTLASRWDFPSTDDSARSFALMLDPNQNLVWMTDDVSTRRPLEVSTPASQLFDGAFHHVAATWTTSLVAVYIDGVAVTTAPSQANPLNAAASTPFRLGSKAGAGDPSGFAGSIDEPAIIRRALSAAEVASVFAGGSTSKCTFSTTSGIVGPTSQIVADVGGVDPVISSDGRYVLFRTRSSTVFPVVTDPALQTPQIDFDLFGTNDDLVLLDTKGTPDTADDTTELVSVNSAGLGGGLDSYQGSMTPDASHIAFASISNDLVANDTLAGRDVFVRDRVNGTTERVSVRSDGSQPQYTATGRNNDSEVPTMDDSGKVIAFESTNRDLAPEANPVPGDTWQTYDIYVRDLTDPNPANHTTQRITVGVGGTKANGSSTTPIVSGDGRYVWYTSAASNLITASCAFIWCDTNNHVDLFVYDRQTSSNTRVNLTGATGLPLDGDVFLSHVSQNGRWVTFSTNATSIVQGDTNGTYDAFLLDTQTGIVRRASSAPGLPQANGASFAGPVSEDGRYVVFQSTATNLVDDDTNARQDIFITDMSMGTTRRVSVGTDGKQRNGVSMSPVSTGDAKHVLYMFQGVGEGIFGIWGADLVLHIP